MTERQREQPQIGEIWKDLNGNFYYIKDVGVSYTNNKVVTYAKISKYGYVIAKTVVVVEPPQITLVDIFLNDTDNGKYIFEKVKTPVQEIHNVNASLNEVVRSLMLNKNASRNKFYLKFEDNENNKIVERTVELDLELFLRWCDMPVSDYEVRKVADTYTYYISVVNYF